MAVCESPGDNRGSRSDGDQAHCSFASVGPAADEEMYRAAQALADAWQPALEHAHRLGWETGWRRGYQDGKRTEHDGWMAALGACRRTMQRPTHAELVARRAADRACICGNCSTCIRRAAVERNRAKFGGDDYPGEAATS
jgi:hypothetical protein